MIQVIAKPLSWMHPNVLTLVGIIPYGLFFIFMQQQRFGWAAIALLFSVIDLLDGAVARANNKVTSFGGFLDSTTDRISDFLMIAGLYAGNLIALPHAALLLLFTSLISYTRARAEAANSTNPAAGGIKKFDQGLIERPERIAIILIATLLQSEILILILTGLSAMTFLQRVWHAYKQLQA